MESQCIGLLKELSGGIVEIQQDAIAIGIAHGREECVWRILSSLSEDEPSRECSATRIEQPLVTFLRKVKRETAGLRSPSKFDHARHKETRFASCRATHDRDMNIANGADPRTQRHHTVRAEPWQIVSTKQE